MEERFRELAHVGQSIWLDYIRRALIQEGGLADLVNAGVRGVTSNPSIFAKAIAQSKDYSDQLSDLCGKGLSPLELYEALALRDIQRAADTLRTVYEATDGLDGYVSLEVNPELAHDTEATIHEARRLFAAVNRPNLLIKVPATAEGIPAIETLIGEGINVNVTLMFSMDQYDAVAEAYISGLEKLEADGGKLDRVASVASFFVSRVDVKVDEMLDRLGAAEAARLKGQTGIANAKLVYQRFQKTFSGERWERLAAKGARLQRVLWASTSTKDPAYSDTLYPDALIGPHTVNTLPPETLEAFLDHGTVTPTLTEGLDEARAQLDQLEKLGIDLNRVTDELLVEGVEKFVSPFASLMDSIRDKCRELRGAHLKVDLGEFQDVVAHATDEMAQDDILERIWDHDYFVWQSEPAEISNRLGWLEIPAVMRRHLDHIEGFVQDVREAGYTHALLLGMGGSSLAADVFGTVLGTKEGYLRLDVLDSTDPGAVLGYDEALDYDRTLFVVASKSGTTAETLSFFRYFYNRTVEVLGEAQAGSHFVAITDPGSPLIDVAQRRDFRAVFVNDATLGGRYSALSYFGLVPARLVGANLGRLLDGALSLTYGCPNCIATGNALSGELGAILGELAKAGRDKMTLVSSPEVSKLGDWVEQLVAESTGKSGTGILPVVDEPLGAPEAYGADRVFVRLILEGGDEAVIDDQRQTLRALREAGHPVVELSLRDLHDLGEQMFLWELAVAVAGYRLGIHPFNQPNVEAAKAQARKMIASYREKGTLAEGEASPLSAEALHRFLAQAEPGDYIALQAYLKPDAATTTALQKLRVQLRDRYRLATTVGYGPRYLHSTGQLHKGDAGNGLFIQFTAELEQDAGIPDEAGDPASSISFGVLERAQALGDRQALLAAGRRVIHFRLGQDVVDGLAKLMGEEG
ncbi:MAG: bifunctional transaldolase/phosoglucose isomerase [Anaerolineae bacterium]